ncbi:hypothetical protein BC938DRAFT_471117 [Jimgerdemannia flammicorona]|uniref:U3 small nucleolar RNA-associated protein 10 n=1 Tax=Jimgerdemannia flammicorona TaxID=994334 RepID=A0A433QV14_9FUNG|nr:hypothetical protein BC938DRAFT_471117 [Jimgerdemannia flammicorona]
MTSFPSHPVLFYFSFGCSSGAAWHSYTMASMLAKQLKNIGTPDARAVKSSQKNRASFLFDSKQAADYDLDTIHSVGVNGLTELCQLDKCFAPFKNTLFSDAMKDVDRVLQTKEENQKLDESIDAFLHQLSQYFLLKPAGKTLEWLIRRFRIHEMNIDSVMQCILPYHETKLFVTMISILQIKDESKWTFLMPIKKTKYPLDRTLLVQRLTKDRSILDFICTLVNTAVARETTFKTLFSFYAATLIGYISAVPRITDDVTTAIMPSILNGLRSRNYPEYQVASYMILSQISSRAQLSKDALVSIFAVIGEYCPKQYLTHMVLCMVHVAQTQEAFDEFPMKAFKHVVDIPNLAALITEISRKYNAERFVETFLVQLVRHSTIHSKYVDVLSTILQSEGLSSSIVRSLCITILDNYLEVKRDNVAMEEDIKPHVRSLLHTLQQRFPAELSAALEEKIKAVGQDKSGEGKKQLKHLYGFVRETFYGTRYALIQDAGTTLYLSLNHTEAGVRLIALRKLVESLEDPESGISKEPDFVHDTLLSRLQDTNESIVHYLLSVPTHLTRFVPAPTLLSTLQTVLDNPTTTRATTRKTLAFLMGYFLKSPDSSSVRSLIFAVVLANVLVTKETRKTSYHVLKLLASSPLKEESVFKGLDELVKLVEQKEGEEKKVMIGEMVKANVEIVKALGENLSKSKELERDVEVWIEALAGQKAAYRVLALLVLSRAVHGLPAARQLPIISRFLTALLANIHLHQQLPIAAINHLDIEAHSGLPSNALLLDLATSNLSLAREIKVELFAIMNLVACIKIPASRIAWLSSEEESDDVEFYKNILGRLYKHFASGADIACYEGAVRGLFDGHLKNDPVEFLCAIWTEDAATTSPLVQVRSLQIADAYFAAYAHDQVAQKIDFQLIVPSLLIALVHPDKVVRTSAIACLQSIRKVYHKAIHNVPVTNGKKAKGPSVAIFKVDDFYGKTSDQLQYLLTETAEAFVTSIVETKDEFLTDCQYFPRFLADTLNKDAVKDTKNVASQKESLLSFLLSHILAFEKRIARITLLHMLSGVHSPTKLKMLLPLLESTLSRGITTRKVVDNRVVELVGLLIKCFTPNTCSLLELKNSKYLRAFVGLLRNETVQQGLQTNEDDENQSSRSICRMTLAQVTERLFGGLSVAKQSEIFAELVELATNGTQDVVKIVKDVFRNVSINAALVIYELSILQEALAQEIEQVAKKSRKANDHNSEPVQALYRLVTILELLEYKSIDDDSALVSPLFETLATMIDSEFHDAPVSLEYINQLLLSSLTSIIRGVEERKLKIEESILRVDLVVQCIRVTGNPRTHNQSLLLMAAIASLYPERVLHNIMPVFTFMGANVLRQDDNYSFQVIQQTLEKIIPPLVASHRRDNESPIRFALQVKPIMKVFVDALFHIPKHRRLRLFTILIQTLGEDDFLYAIITLILEKYTEKLHKGRATEADSLSEFCLTVSSQFSPKTQVTSLIALMENLLLLPNEKSDDYPEGTVPEPNSLFDLTEHTNKQLRQFKLASLNFASLLLVSKGFLSKLLTLSHVNGNYENEMQDYYLKMAKILLRLVSYFGTYQAAYAKKGDATPVITKFWRGLLKLTYDVLDKVNVLLPLPSFINNVSSLLADNDAMIRRKAMLLFNDRISGIKGELAADDKTRVIGMAKNLAIIIGDDRDAAVAENETAVNKQAALSCLSTLVRGFAKVDPSPFANVIPSVIGKGALQHPNLQVKASSLVCLTFLCQEVGPRVVPNMPRFMPVVLDIMHSTLKSDHINILLQLSSISALETIVRTLPHFVSPYISKILGAVMHPSIAGYEGVDGQRAQVLDKSKSLLSELATKVQPRVLLPPLFAYFETAITQGKKTLLALYDMVGEAIRTMTRNIITGHYKQLFKFFLLAFDFRRLHNKDFSAEDVDDVEQHIISAFLELVMKLNETLFKPLFLKTLDWATVELTMTGSIATTEDMNNRLLFFYKLMDNLLDRLKVYVIHSILWNQQTLRVVSIIAPYYGYVLDNCIERLQGYKNGDAEPDKLWSYVVRSLHKSLLYDTDSMWTAEKFEKILHPLVDQLLVTSSDADIYMERVRTDLIPCVGQLAVTVSNDTLWKPLNHQVLMKTREDDVEIRLAALRCLEEFYSRLGEEWLLFLAESISFLAELMEDDDTRVEKLTQEVCAQIETYLGESLDKYFH